MVCDAVSKSRFTNEMPIADASSTGTVRRERDSSNSAARKNGRKLTTVHTARMGAGKNHLRA